MMNWILKILLSFIFSSLHGHNLSILAIFRDEARYLKEWIEFHKLVGVEHFYLFNNYSQDDFESILQPYIQRGEVELFQWPFLANSWENWIYEIQPCAYQKGIEIAKGKTKWLAIIDIDEFLTPIEKETVPEILKEFEDFGGVCFNWKIFGTSGFWELPPDKLLIESLTLCASKERPTHLGIKSIVQPGHVKECHHPHYVIYNEGFYHVNSNKESNISKDGTTDQVYYDKVVINHYWSREGKYLYHKLRRYQPWAPHIDPEKWQDYVTSMNEISDSSMQKFIAKLKTRL